MRQIKITNYTTTDWLKEMGSILCASHLAQQAIRTFMEGDWYRGLMYSLGTLGWLLLCLRVSKDIQRKNPQEELKD